MANDEGFLARWSRRKGEVKTGVVAEEPKEVEAPLAAVQPVAAASQPAAALPAAPGFAGPDCASGSPHAAQNPRLASSPLAEGETQQARRTPPPPPTLDDVALLTSDSDYSRFVAPSVDAGVRNAALRKLFSDPRYNVMDGLDVYIDDYTKPDPIPASMLRQMVQSKFLGLFDDEEKDKEGTRLAQHESAPPASDNPAPDENSDLRLQPDDAAGRPGADEGAGPRES